MALDLSEIRQQITQIDRSLLKLLSERHRLAYDVVRSKEVTQIISLNRSILRQSSKRSLKILC